MEDRAAFRPPERAAPRDAPNANDPATTPPGTVGPLAVGDDPGSMFVDGPPAGASRGAPPRPQPWDGWPTEWATPNWYGRLNDLTDTAWACLDINSSIIGSMPPYVVGPTSSIDWITNPDPDRYPSWFAFARQLLWDYMLGEVFVLTTARYDDNGYPARFHVVPPWMVNVEMDGSDRVFSIGNLDVTADMLHIPYQITGGEAHGHGPLEAGRARLVAAATLSRYATNLAAAGAVPNAVLVHPTKLNAVQAEDLQSHWVNARMSSMGLPAVLSGGLDFKTLSFSPKDMALIELAQFNEGRIAMLLGVPAHMVGLPADTGSLTYTSTPMLTQHHWAVGLKPKVSAVFGALSGWLLPRGTVLEVNRDEYVRPGPLERAQTWEILIRNNIMSVEQVQEIERTINAAVFAPLSSGVLK